MPRAQAEMTRMAVIGKRIRTRSMVSACSPGSNPIEEDGHQDWRQDDSQEAENPGGKGEQPEDRACEPGAFLVSPCVEKFGIYRDERCRKRAFPKEVLEHVRHAKCGSPGVGRTRRPPK